MHHVAHVQKGQAAQDVVDKFYQMVLREVYLVLQQRVQIRINELDDDAYVHKVILFCLLATLLFRRGLLRTNDLDELRNERAFILFISLQFVCDLVETTQNLNFS